MTRGFEDVVASSTMIRSSFASTKNKRIIGTTNLVLALKRGLTLLF